MDPIEERFFIEIRAYLESTSETAGEVVLALDRVAAFLDGLGDLPDHDSNDIQALALALRMQSSATTLRAKKAREIVSQMDAYLR